MGSLELYMYTTITPRKSIFKKEGEHGTTWRLQRGDVYATNLGKGLMHVGIRETSCLFSRLRVTLSNKN